MIRSEEYEQVKPLSEIKNEILTYHDSLKTITTNKPDEYKEKYVKVMQSLMPKVNTN